MIVAVTSHDVDLGDEHLLALDGGGGGPRSQWLQGGTVAVADPGRSGCRAVTPVPVMLITPRLESSTAPRYAIASSVIVR